METTVIVAIVLFTSVFLTLLLNGFVIANYARRRRLRANNAIASNILYVYSTGHDQIDKICGCLAVPVNLFFDIT